MDKAEPSVAPIRVLPVGKAGSRGSDRAGGSCLQRDVGGMRRALLSPNTQRRQNVEAEGRASMSRSGL
ncbi:MAG: hypothetical protein M3Y41_10395 [Pseudomonadota bacterium]|nr:hypothetical protein [Pseudomonadota bacterium]